jgi:tetratricopeptide (TPR) repeat protein
MDTRSNRYRRRHARRLPRLSLVAIQLTLIVLGAFGVLALGAAEAEFRRDTPDAVRRAASLGNSRYEERLAELDPEHARDILREALRADPRAASVWISLGLKEEHSAEAGLREKSLRERGLLEKSSADKSLIGNRAARKIVAGDRLGDFRFAREAFEAAFRVDQQYAPAWALANFCFRRGDQECFWRAASRAVARAPAWAQAPAPGYPNLTDLAPLLELASRMDPSPAYVLDRLSSGVPGAESSTSLGATLGTTRGTPLERTPGTTFVRRFATLVATLRATPYATPYATAASVAAPLERAYLDDLIGKSQWEDAEMVARRMSSELARSEVPRGGAPDEAPQDPSDAARLDDFVTRLIAAGRALAAVGLWNEYAGFAALDVARGFSLTNGDFGHEPRNAGFDWRLGFGPAAAGYSRRTDSAHAGPASDGIEPQWTPFQLEFRFTGEEPEQRQLAEQWLPLGQQRYRLSFEYETRSLPSPTGIRWEFATTETSAEAPSLEPSAGWRTAQWSFGGAAGLAPLRLIYNRAPGTVRARGSFLIRRVRLEFLSLRGITL